MKTEEVRCKRCKKAHRKVLWIAAGELYCQGCFDWIVENTNVDIGSVKRLSDEERYFEFPYVRKSRTSGAPASAVAAVRG
jgi:hypothetical protein